jgi:hypothetical protein
VFGEDVVVLDHCNEDVVGSKANSTSGFGTVYVNDTGLDGETFFTGSGKFTVKEIEVFEIAD